jgi:hypothetical protein
MDFSPFVFTLLAVATPILAVLAGATWLAGSEVDRVRFASRDGRILLELVLAKPAHAARDAENPVLPAFRP